MGTGTQRDNIVIGPRNRHCLVCALPHEQLDAVNRAAKGELQADGQKMSMRALHAKYEMPFTTQVLTKHKYHCLGLKMELKGGAIDPAKLAERALVHEQKALELVDRKETRLWVAAEAQNEARCSILKWRDRLQEQLEQANGNPTAAYYQVLLEYNREIIKESEKASSALENQATSYLEQVQAQRREITRTVTVKETVTTVAGHPDMAPANFVEVQEGNVNE